MQEHRGCLIVPVDPADVTLLQTVGEAADRDFLPNASIRYGVLRLGGSLRSALLQTPLGARDGGG